MLQTISLFGVFGAVFVFTFFILGLLEKDKIKLKKRVTEVVGPEVPVPIRQQELSFPLFQRFIRPMLSGIFAIVARYIPATNEEVLQKRLSEAGNPYNLLPRELMAIKYVTAIFFTVGTKLVLQNTGKSHIQVLVILIAVCILGWLLPDVIINSKGRQRKEQVSKELPEVLDLLTVCIEAGLGFDGAIKKVVDKSKGVLPDEMAIVLQEIRMGKPRRDALRDMADRLMVDDFSNFVGSIIMAEQLGISVGKVLRLQSKDVRQKRRQRIEEMAMKAPVKMLLPMVFCIFPAIFVVLLGPAAIQIMKVFGQ